MSSKSPKMTGPGEVNQLCQLTLQNQPDFCWNKIKIIIMTDDDCNTYESYLKVHTLLQMRFRKIPFWLIQASLHPTVSCPQTLASVISLGRSQAWTSARENIV